MFRPDINDFDWIDTWKTKYICICIFIFAIILCALRWAVKQWQHLSYVVAQQRTSHWTVSVVNQHLICHHFHLCTVICSWQWMMSYRNHNESDSRPDRGSVVYILPVRVRHTWVWHTSACLSDRNNIRKSTKSSWLSRQRTTFQHPRNLMGFITIAHRKDFSLMTHRTVVIQ